MYHPELEQKLADLKAQRKKTLEDFRDLASDAIDSADRSCKTMMMFIPPIPTCDCKSTNGTTCSCPPKSLNTKKAKTKRFKRKKKKTEE